MAGNDKNVLYYDLRELYQGCTSESYNYFKFKNQKERMDKFINFFLMLFQVRADKQEFQVMANYL